MKMKVLKGMNKQGRMLLMAALMFCAFAGFARKNSALAADKVADSDTVVMEYLDPFDLTVTTISASAAESTAEIDNFLFDSVILASSSSSIYSDYAQPLKIWIPYRPVFRSPCTPSW